MFSVAKDRTLLALKPLKQLLRAFSYVASPSLKSFLLLMPQLVLLPPRIPYTRLGGSMLLLCSFMIWVTDIDSFISNLLCGQIFTLTGGSNPMLKRTACTILLDKIKDVFI